MAGLLNVFSLNIGMKDNLAGLENFLNDENFDVIFLQEVRISNDQLQSKVVKYGYVAEVNINEDESFKPGTAFIWKSSIPIENVVPLVQCRCQVAYVGRHILINIYAPSGSDKRHERASLFAKDLFQFMSLQGCIQALFGSVGISDPLENLVNISRLFW